MPSVTIHCIRHAQGYHNLNVANHALTDPSLTPHGETQCTDLQAAHFPPSTQRRISLIAASPLTRTLHTAYITFQPLLDPTHPAHHEANTNSNLTKPQIIALPDAQETSDFPCDTGSSPSLLANRVSQNDWPVDLALLNGSWTNKALGTRYSPHSDAIKARARDTRVYLRQRARELLLEQQQKVGEDADVDIEIVLVTHGGFLHYFTGDWEDATRGLGTGWTNCETRAYRFESGADANEDADADALLVETQQSRERRGKTGPQRDREAQKTLFEATMQGWEAAGLQRPDRIGIEGVEWKSGLVLGKESREFDLPVPSSEGMGLDELTRQRSGSVTVRAQA